MAIVNKALPIVRPNGHDHHIRLRRADHRGIARHPVKHVWTSEAGPRTKCLKYVQIFMPGSLPEQNGSGLRPSWNLRPMQSCEVFPAASPVAGIKLSLAAHC